MAGETTDVKIQDIPLSEIYSDPNFNCRGAIAPIDVVDLSQSMDQRGLDFPIMVQPYSSQEQPGKKWRIIAGHRRHKAAELLRWETIPCIIKEGLSEIDARVKNLTENIQRKALNILQEAKAIEHFRNVGLPQDDVAKYLGQSRGWVQVRYYLLDLAPEIQKEAAAGMLTNQQIRDLYSAPTKERFELVKKIKDAKERGEKTPRLKQPKKTMFTKKLRDRNEIFEMMDHIAEYIGYNFATRAMAWCAGEITDFDFHRDIKEQAEAMGINYEIPKEALPQVPAGVNASPEE